MGTFNLVMRGGGDRDGEVTMCTLGPEGGREAAEHRWGLGTR